MIIIYCAGEYGKAVKAFLNSCNIYVDYFCETESSGARVIDGIKVVSLCDLPNILVEQSLVLIAIKNKNVSKKIKLRLTSIFLDKAHIVEVGEFISNNLMYMGGETLPVMRQQCG